MGTDIIEKMTKEEKSNPVLSCGVCSKPFEMGTTQEFHRGREYSGDYWETYHCVSEKCYYIDLRGLMSQTNIRGILSDLNLFSKDKSSFTKWVDEEAEKWRSKISEMKISDISDDLAEEARNIAIDGMIKGYRDMKLNNGRSFHKIMTSCRETDYLQKDYKPGGIPFHIDCINNEIDIDRESTISMTTEDGGYTFQITGKKYRQFLLNHRSDFKEKLESCEKEIRGYLDLIRFEEATIDAELRYWDGGQK